jgi:deazaflavin-dependent oxidoreductase (nitroreductase family)
LVYGHFIPLRVVDPKRRSTVLSRASTRFGRNRAGQFVAKHIAPKTDPWLGRVSNGSLCWGVLAAPSATLTTMGARTGQPRQVQIAYFHDGRDAIAVASNFGGEKHPHWYYNLAAPPECELGGQPFRATEVTAPMEHARLYDLAERSYAGYIDYRAKTVAVGRQIPILRLTPTD